MAASGLTILSLTAYPAMYDILGPVAGEPGALADRTLVNLSSDTPDTSRDTAA
ncbi:hypothetical protein [Verrucosispora sp. WMMD573]|uniref:hypothetical protein n=1 Tax=Verrucosispora sp. WMMD573 TaxID=3015149 RepID=UPI00248CC793|nr:hypothetical protein [Verrucosispora sp. WMMD573]WBB56694.1 hypothetical protein O7601_11825 [Verrucosispora sp. WMMD573]